MTADDVVKSIFQNVIRIRIARSQRPLRQSSGALVQGFAALCATLIVAVSASAAADPVEKVLHLFSGYPSDGASPYAGLIADSKGNLYGTTNVGGASYCFGGGCGTVFELSPPATAGGTWTKKVLYSFTGGSDGGNPQASLIADSKGNLYGTTNSGGASCPPAYSTRSCGTVFKLAPPASAGGAWTETVLYTFTGGSDGGYPPASLIADSKGNLYGTTSAFGTGGGTVFQLTGSGFVGRITFAGTPGMANCFGQSVSALARQFGGLSTAAWSLGFGFSGVRALQSAIHTYCGDSP